MNYKKLLTFFQEDIWKIKEGDVSMPALVGIDIVRTVVLAIRSFVDTRITRAAAALSFSTMMAIVPMVAVVFAIARGFGISKHIESWFGDLLSSQPQVAETIIGFVNSYLVNAKSGVILGFGFIVMLYTVIMLISNVETTFNDIWKVENSRGLMSTVIDYVAFFFLLPIVITLTSGVSIFVTTMSGHLGEFVAPVVRVLIAVSPYIIMSVIFTMVYMLMPNTKVYFSSAVGPGIFAGIAMQLLQLLYIHSQLWVTSYNAIYGSFAALPLFMLWLQFSWIICLFGVHLCYTRQNMERLMPMPFNERVSEKNRRVLSAILLAHICKRFANAQGPCTTLQLKKETGVPAHVVAELLAGLLETKLVVNVAGSDKDRLPAYMPGEDIANITVGEMVDRLDDVGAWPMIDDELKKAIGEKTRWGKAFQIRKIYIDQLRTLKVSDLEIS
ncbi:MAG: YihY/virulence factor BrkB family protein [Prevotella sp.]|nr:YihY/virulence factor BrkB family protein [Prevotella sp.]